MTEYQKTKQDLNTEAYDFNNDPTLIFLRHQGEQQFNVGDILIRTYKYCDEWKVEMASSTTDVPKKYLYAFENELGIGYIKAFKTDGKLSETATCMTQFNLGDTRFVLDPEYADHIMIGDGEFKPHNSFREKKRFRDRAIANNKKLMIPKDAASILAWVNNLNVGDEFYYGYHVPDMVENKYRILGIEEVPIMQFDSWDRDRIIKNLSLRIDDKIRKVKLENIKCKWGTPGSRNTVTAHDLIGQSITTKEPFPLAEAQ